VLERHSKVSKGPNDKKKSSNKSKDLTEKKSSAPKVVVNVQVEKKKDMVISLAQRVHI